MASVQQALTYPFQIQRPVMAYAGGYLSLVLWPFILPLVYLTGYFGQVLRARIDDESPPDFFVDWRKTLRLGGTLFLTTLGYLAVPILTIVATALIVGVPSASMSAGESAVTESSSPAIGLLIASFFPLLCSVYLLPGAFAHAARTGLTKKGFAVGELRSVWFSKSYVAHFIGLFVIFQGVALVSPLLALLTTPLVMVFLLPFIYLYAAIVASWLTGSMYRDSVESAGEVGALTADDLA